MCIGVICHGIKVDLHFWVISVLLFLSLVVTSLLIPAFVHIKNLIVRLMFYYQLYRSKVNLDEKLSSCI